MEKGKRTRKEGDSKDNLSCAKDMLEVSWLKWIMACISANPVLIITRNNALFLLFCNHPSEAFGSIQCLLSHWHLICIHLQYLPLWDVYKMFFFVSVRSSSLVAVNYSSLEWQTTPFVVKLHCSQSLWLNLVKTLSLNTKINWIQVWNMY